MQESSCQAELVRVLLHLLLHFLVGKNSFGRTRQYFKLNDHLTAHVHVIDSKKNEVNRSLIVKKRGEMMKFQIVWNAFFAVKNEVKAARLIKQIEKITGHLIVSQQFEWSKKNPSLLGAAFVSKLKDDMTKEAAVFQTLQTINKLGTAWTVYSPVRI